MDASNLRFCVWLVHDTKIYGGLYSWILRRGAATLSFRSLSPTDSTTDSVMAYCLANHKCRAACSTVYGCGMRPAECTPPSFTCLARSSSAASRGLRCLAPPSPVARAVKPAGQHIRNRSMEYEFSTARSLAPAAFGGNLTDYAAPALSPELIRRKIQKHAGEREFISG